MLISYPFPVFSKWLFLFFIFTFTVNCLEADPLTREEKIKLLQNPIHGIFYKPTKVVAGKKVLLGLWVMGSAPLPRGLRKSVAKKVARERANRDARRELAVWLKQNVNFETVGGEQRVTLNEGREDEETQIKITETKTFKSSSRQILRGLVVKSSKFDVEEDEYQVVLGWSPTYADLARQAEKSMRKEIDNPNSDNGRKNNSADGKWKSETKIAPNIDDF
ncbi:hypothetical protein ACFL35_10580 [Candidatus Riflebacteria bacterium]